MRSNIVWPALALSLCLHPSASPAQSARPTISLDEYMNATAITAARLSPDGSAAVIATEAPNWKANVFQHDLWLWTASAGLRPLTHSGSEQSPQWSPDGKWVAFVSDRALPGQPATDDGAPASDADKADRLWLISVSGGEALPLYTEKLSVHAFAWSADGAALYFSATRPLTPEQKETQKNQWKDVIRYREQNRGDLLLKLPVEPALARATRVPLPLHPETGKAVASPELLPPGAQTLASSSLSITQIAPSPDRQQLAFVTGPVHERVENPSDFEIFFVPANGGEARQVTHNHGIESHLVWSHDARWLHFQVGPAAGFIEGPYKDVQGRLYRMDPATGKIQRLGADFKGSFDKFTLLPDGRELATGLTGMETQVYLVEDDHAKKLPGLAGSYTGLASARASSAILFLHSTINDPTQVYLASDPLHPDRLTALTAFNPIFAQRAQPEWQPYTWKSDDGRAIEGVLIFPPGKKSARHLRMLTLIHGGPDDADGNRFGADWYDWATFAADNGWLVFRPNYRGSSGYGDDFMLEIAPHLVSKPGRDILTGVDALVKDGYADPNHLAIGGYSYGGYMTNWLITQTTRFKSAVTGAGAVEHAANWGNDDLTFDDAWFLGGRPWEDPGLYQSEAALFQFNKVKTPTHLVQGGADVRVSYLEGVTMERALQSLGIPHTFLVFPGEGHGLPVNPWHGYIKVREELKWLDKYDGK
ncbi:MAG: S9 family peptidase [Acidobacteriota bacterium]|nr:S9 family peptidase [Acidobacteriota bacterium]